jgi:hypothetical protein
MVGRESAGRARKGNIPVRFEALEVDGFEFGTWLASE